MFYNFDQNNSGGSFVKDEERGLTSNVIIEAASADEANNKAEEVGIYFDGEYDCPCCGNRWSMVSEYDAKEVPSVFGEPVTEYLKKGFQWMADGKNVVVHYADGRVEWF